MAGFRCQAATVVTPAGYQQLPVPLRRPCMHKLYSVADQPDVVACLSCIGIKGHDYMDGNLHRYACMQEVIEMHACTY